MPILAVIPLGVVAGGGLIYLGNNMSEKAPTFLKEFDWIRKINVWTARDIDMMGGSIFFLPAFRTLENDFGNPFIETSWLSSHVRDMDDRRITIGMMEGLLSLSTGQDPYGNPCGVWWRSKPADWKKKLELGKLN